MTQRILLPVLALSAACLVAPACALGTSDTVAGPGGFDAGDPPHDATAADNYTPGFGFDSGPDTSDDAGELPDGTATDTGPSDSSLPSDASNDAAAPDAPSDTGGGCPEHGFTGTLATFNLASQPGDEATAAVTSTATGVTSGPLGRASTITAVSGTGSINGSNWGTGSSADATRYYTFTVTPAAGCSLHATSLTYDVKASSTGPAHGDVATSVDSFGTHSTAFAGTSTGTATLSATSSGAVEVRVYGFGASSSSGTFRIENTLTLGGSLE